MELAIFILFALIFSVAFGLWIERTEDGYDEPYWLQDDRDN